jgi:ABC-type Fe3+ transport system permease subunit/DNA-binding beta-propeller fold protein YncE
MDPALLGNSLAVTAAATALAFCLGLPVALVCQAAPSRARRALLAASVATLALPGFFVAGAWMRWTGFAGAWRWGESWWTLRILPLACSAAVLGFMLWPITTLMLNRVWSGVDGRLIEANPELRGWALARHVLWPAARGRAAQPALITAALALGNFSVPALFQARVWPVEVWIDYATQFDARGPLEKSWILGFVAIGLAAWSARGRSRWPASGYPIEPRLLRERLGPWLGILAWGGVCVALGLGLAAPLGLAASDSRAWTELGAATAAGWPAAVRSVACAMFVATLVCGLGVLAARWRWPAGAVVFFALPGVGVGMLATSAGASWIGAPIQGTSALMIAALVVRYGFLGWFAANHAWRSRDPRLADLERVQGAGPWVQWRHGVWPRSGAALTGAWMLVYLLCLWDVETVIFVSPPGGDPLSLMIFNFLHYGHTGQVMALCAILGLAAAAPALVGAVLTRRGGFGAAALCAPVLFLGAGCGSSQDGTGAELDSRLFERVEVIGARGTGPGFFNKPRSVAVDGGDNLYVVDMTGRVQKFDPDGRWLLAWQMPETTAGKAKGMAGAQDGVWVVEPHYHRVNEFDGNGRLVTQWGRHGTGPGELWFPRSIAVSESGDAYVSEYGVVERVQRFRSSDGAFAGSFGSAGSGPGRFNRVEGVGLDSAGNVYVADSCNHRVQVFSPDGTWLRAHGRAGHGVGEMSYPYDVRIDSAGRQYVCEFGNSRVQIFDAGDRPLEILGGPGNEPGRMHNPWSVCLNSRGDLFVADSGNHRVLRFVRRTERAELRGSGKGDRRGGPRGSRESGRAEGC